MHLPKIAAAALLCSLPAAAGTLAMEYAGEVVNTGPASAQFGNLLSVACAADPAASYTFYTEATTTRATANGPLRVIRRTGTTTIYLARAPGDFAAPESFRAGTPILVSRLDQQVILDTTTGLFTVVNLNTTTSAAKEAWAHGCPLAREGGELRTVLTGRLNSAGPPTGWFGGYGLIETARPSQP